jgi:hypothetical protein
MKSIDLPTFIEYRLNGVYYSLHDSLLYARVAICPKEHLLISDSGVIKGSHLYLLHNSDRADYVSGYISHVSHCTILDESQLGDLEKKVLSEGTIRESGLCVLDVTKKE